MAEKVLAKSAGKMVKNCGLNCNEMRAKISVPAYVSINELHVNNHWLNWKNESKLNNKIGQNEQKVTMANSNLKKWAKSLWKWSILKEIRAIFVKQI